jgi:hypothetical protein
MRRAIAAAFLGVGVLAAAGTTRSAGLPIRLARHPD